MTPSRLSPEAARARLIRETLAANVRRQRKRAGFTQEELASASTVPRDTISRIERAQREARLTTLDLLASAMRLSVQDLLAGFPASRSAPKGT